MSESDVLDLNDRNWEAKVEKGTSPMVVMFFSPNCPHCQMMMPHFLGYAKEFKGKVAFARINVLENPYTAERYGIFSTPTFKFFCGGRPVQELVGAVYPTILKKITEEALEHGPTCMEKSTRINYDMAYV
jgi:thioredoxin 1